MRAATAAAQKDRLRIGGELHIAPQRLSNATGTTIKFLTRTQTGVLRLSREACGRAQFLMPILISASRAHAA